MLFELARSFFRDTFVGWLVALGEWYPNGLVFPLLPQVLLGPFRAKFPVTPGLLFEVVTCYSRNKVLWR